MEQVTADRVEVQRAREELLREQKRVTTELQEERRSVAMERAQLSSAHREIITREKHKSDNTIQVTLHCLYDSIGIFTVIITF